MMNTVFIPIAELFADHIKNLQKFDMKVQHYHDAYEIYFQADGERYMFLDDICYTIKKGDIVILKPFDIHYMESRDIDFYERYVMNFNADMLRIILTDAEIKLLLEDISSCVFHLDSNQAEIVLDCFKTIMHFKNRKGALSEKLTFSAVFRLLAEIKDFSKIAQVVTSRNTPHEIVIAIDYINKHYKEDIDLKTISDAAHLSKYHFARLFRKSTGATFLQYLYNVRLVKVHNLLANTTIPIKEIALRTGFTSNTHLTRIFKQAYNVSPKQFRNSLKKQ